MVAALANLDHLVVILAAMNRNRTDPTSIQLLVFEALTYVNRSKHALNLEPVEPARP